MQVPPTPFKILALAPFSSSQPTPWSKPPIRIDKTNIDQVMEGLDLSFYISLSKDLCPAGGLNISCNKLKDFHPDTLIQNNIFLRHLLEARELVEQANAKRLSEEEVKTRLEQWPELPPIEIKYQSKKPEKTKENAIDDILKLVSLPETEEAPIGTHGITAKIDAYIQQALVHIYSHESLKTLEAVWRGVKLLVDQGGINGEIRLEIVPVDFDTLDETLENLLADPETGLPSLLLVDLPMNNTPRCLEAFKKIAQFSDTLLTPAICWITHNFLQIESWEDLGKLSYLPHHMEGAAYAKWHHLKTIPQANWIAVTCNPVLARYPYGPDNMPRSVRFEEQKLLWTSPAWAIACLMGQSHDKTGWPTRFTQWQEIRLEGLPLVTSVRGKPCPTKARIGAERLQQIITAGFMPLIAGDKDSAFTPADISIADSSFAYQILVSRVSHFLLLCQENFKASLAPENLRETLKRAFSLFWQNSGHPVPRDLEISTTKPQAKDAIVVKITFKPSREVLPSKQKVELEFLWNNTANHDR